MERSPKSYVAKLRENSGDAVKWIREDPRGFSVFVVVGLLVVGVAYGLPLKSVNAKVNALQKEHDALAITVASHVRDPSTSRTLSSIAKSKAKDLLKDVPPMQVTVTPTAACTESEALAQEFADFFRGLGWTNVVIGQIPAGGVEVRGVVLTGRKQYTDPIPEAFEKLAGAFPGETQNPSFRETDPEWQVQRNWLRIWVGRKELPDRGNVQR
ncbi:MAG: hypothetical protein KF791_02305 [Verrucomicrobiae bacterium]|nr:hypothetical protein [Verrucomicrobiae bacterium]